MMGDVAQATIQDLMQNIFFILGSAQHLSEKWIIAVSSSVLWEKAMAPHSSTLAWKIPWTEEPGRLQSMGSLGVGHD